MNLLKRFSLRPIAVRSTGCWSAALAIALLPAAIAVNGCGSSGYAGQPITSLSATSVTIDAGQTFGVTATEPNNLPITWTLSGSSCSGSACGSLSTASGLSTAYTAPAPLSAPIQVVLTATISGTQSSKVTNITVNPAPVISGATPNGTVGTAYSATLTTTGGTGTSTLSLASGTLPAGLTFNASTGVISGTPTAVGTSSFVIQAVDQSSVPYTATASRQITISTNTPALSAAGTPPAGTVGVAYSSALTASGGTAPYTWTLTSGSLPAGLTLSSGGVISGTPTAAGTSTFTAQVKDSSGATATVSASIAISAAQSTLTVSGTLPSATTGTPYTSTIGVSGGSSPYTCTIVSGSLPAGLTLSAGCTVSGTPTVSGTSTPTIGVTDSGNPAQSTTKPVSITVNPGSSAITLASPPAGTVGTPYSGTIPVTGGTSPYNCSITSGSLPAGLTLGSNCTITGTPTTPGTSTVTVTGTDSSNPTNSGTAPITVTINPSTASLTLGAPGAATVGTPYSGTIPVSGGSAPYLCTQTGGTLPAGLSLGSNCVITGTPTTSGTVSITVSATDGSSPTRSGSGSVPVTVNPAASVTLTVGQPPAATVNTPYTGTIPVSGGTGPYSCSITSGSLPSGLSLGANCTVSGTPTTSGSTTVTVKGTDSSNPANTGTGPVVITVNGSTAGLTVGTPPAGTVNTPYSGTVPVSGGTAPYTCTLTGGTLPAGLTLGTNCVISGTPTAAGTSNVTVSATDSSSPTRTGSNTVPVTINAATVLTLGQPPAATVNTPYSGTIPVTGGTAPYACSITSGTLPSGLSLGANCTITGTPTSAGSSTVTVRATDSANPANTGTGPVTVTVNGSTSGLTLGTPPAGTVNTPYSATVPVTGGTGPYACTLTGGTLPAGLTLGANCTISGTPTAAGTSNVTLAATDSSSPQKSGSGPVAITINAPVTLTLGQPPAATVNTPYTGTIPVTGGTAPYTCTVNSGTLPAGLSLGANCTISGTPTTAGSATLSVTATDSTSPTRTGTGAVTVTVNGSTAGLTIGAPPAATINTAYSGTVPVSGGTAPYTCTQTGGTLPAGLTLGSNCVITGTPTVAGTSNITVSATDSSNPQKTGSNTVPVTVNAASTLTLGQPPAATVNTPYTGTIPVSGGTSPYSCVINSGSLPAGLTLGANCTISGTPTTAGSSTVSVTATDSTNPARTGTGSVTVTVNGAATTLTIGNPPTATVSTPYTGTIPVTGGTAPYSCTINSGTALPAGLALGANCTITGTPTAAGSTTVSVTATDSASPQHTSTGPATVTVQALQTLSLTGTLPNAVVGQAYTQTLHATGGVAPYTYAVTAGTLPAGLSLSSAGVLSGTPTAPGASSFTVTVTDSETTAQTATNPYVLLVTYPTTPNDSLLKGPYAFLFQGYDDAVLGVLAYQTATIGSFTADGAAVLTAGELDTNHQASNPAGSTVPSRTFLGTYTVGSDLRGNITITQLNTDGTTGATTTFAIALRAPVSPATTASTGSLIQYDGNQLAGTKGSGTLLQQTSTAIATGLSGSYAFGVSGDTPCLPTCTVGLLAGPVAGVGQFNAAGGAITGGTADTNIAANNYPNSTLSGTYTAADINGRVQLTLNTSGLAGSFYPTDYAAYIVDSNRVLLMSTDKHSAFILQAGSATLQSQTTFSSASLGAPFVGYENSPVNPGLVGQTLQNVLNLSTATIFRGTGNGNGTCTVTNVDVGGTNGIISALTALGSNVPLLNTVFGSYQATGTANCTVSGNGRVLMSYPPSNTILTPILGGLGIGGSTPSPRAVYLTAPNAGYFLETGYAGLGILEAQVGSPFSLATFTGTYVYGTIPASSLAPINSSGVFTADGAGHATSTLDENIGVGTLNVLQLGVSGTANYSLTDATAGRYLLGASRVIYAITPGRFVLLEGDLVSTAPYIALLY